MAQFRTTRQHDELRKMLREARERSGLSQRDLSKQLGQVFTYVHKVEGGERGIDVVEVVRFLQAVGADPRAFFEELVERIV